MDKKLIKTASVIDDFDEAFELMAKGFGIEDEAYDEKNFSMVPNVPEVRRIMKQGNVKYYELGLWIVTIGISLDDTAYDHENSIFDALSKSDLYPYYGNGISFTNDYLNI